MIVFVYDHHKENNTAKKTSVDDVLLLQVNKQKMFLGRQHSKDGYEKLDDHVEEGKVSLFHPIIFLFCFNKNIQDIFYTLVQRRELPQGDIAVVQRGTFLRA